MLAPLLLQASPATERIQPSIMHDHPIRTHEVRVEAFDFQVVHLFTTARELYRDHHATGAEAVELLDGVAGRQSINTRPAGHVAVGGRFDEERVLLGGLNRRERVVHRRIDGHERDEHNGRALAHVGLEHFAEGELAGLVVGKQNYDFSVLRYRAITS